MTVRAALTRQVQAALTRLYQEDQVDGAPPALSLSLPREAAHGDFTCTVALNLARPLKQNPRAIAQRLQATVGRRRRHVQPHRDRRPRLPQPVR